MERTYIKSETIFNHIVDDTAIKIINLGDNSFIWIQYGPSEDSTCGVEVCKQYTKKEISNMVELFETVGSLSSIELFNKFINL